jgi:hypothetical protein
MGARTSMYNRNYVVGLPGFEPGTSASRTQRATKLRYSPRRVTPQPDNPSRRALVHTKRYSMVSTGTAGLWYSATTSLMRLFETDWTRKLQLPSV